VNIVASVAGTSVTITATASVGDTGTLTYQWYRNMEENSRTGTPITGAVGTTYMPSTASPGTTYYYVKVTNTLKGQTSTATSNIVGVTVHAGGGSVDIIEVVDIPQVGIAANVVGRTVTITATATVNDGGRLSYQWYSNEQNNRNGEEITGATDRVYTPPTDNVGTMYYYVRVTNTLNGKTAIATSNIVSVVIPEGGGSVEVIEVETPDVEAPKVTIAAEVVGRNVTITAKASVSDGGELSYQWYRNNRNNKNGGTLIDGAEGAIYAASTEAVGTAYYYVEVTNSLNGNVASATSNIVGVVVPEDGGSVEVVEAEIPSVSVIASPAPGPYAVGAVVVLTASAAPVSDGGTVTYQWYSNNANNKNGTLIADATGILYTAATASLGTTYYYALATNTLRGNTASASSNIVEIKVAPTEIRNAAVTVITPVKSAVPNAQAIKGDSGNYEVGEVAWTTDDDTEFDGAFAGGVAYTATVTLTANEGYIFASNFTGRINNYSGTVVTPNDDGSVTLTHTFAKTFSKDVGSVTISSQPSKLHYVYGEALDFTGLSITITYDDASTETGAYTTLVEELGDQLSASPEHGDIATVTTHNAKAIVINAGGKTAQSNSFLTVTQKPLAVTVTQPSRPLSILDTTATFSVTVNGLANDDTVTVSLPTLPAGVSRSGGSLINIKDGTQNLTLTYNGFTAVTTPVTVLNVGLTTSVAEGNYAVSSTPSVTLTVLDGQAAGDRAIPVRAETIAAFNTYANTPEGLTRHYKLTEDVTLTTPAAGQSNNWKPIGSYTSTAVNAPFTGSFDGQKKTITNLKFFVNVGEGNVAGMFGSTSGVIKNLGLKSPSITIATGGDISYAGGVVGRLEDNGMVENCFVEGRGSNLIISSAGSTNNYIGGVVGAMVANGTVQNCYVVGHLESQTPSTSNSIGGVVGRLLAQAGTVQNCYMMGNVIARNNTSSTTNLPFVGGVVGLSSTVTPSTIIVTKCYTGGGSIYCDKGGTAGRVVGQGAVSNFSYLYSNMNVSTNGTSQNQNIGGGSLTSKDGKTTSTASGNVENPTTEAFWTTPANWGGTAWDFTNIWEWSSTLTRPILKGFTAGVQE
jgi:hypothetical protein